MMTSSSSAYGNSAWSNTESPDVFPPQSWTTIGSEGSEAAFPGPWTVQDLDPSSGLYYWGKRDCRAYNSSYSG